MEDRMEAALAGLLGAAFEPEAELRAAAEAVASAFINADLPPIDPYTAPDALKAIRACLKTLRDKRAYKALEAACEALEGAGLRTGWLLQWHAQTLVERGALLPASGLVNEALAAATEAGDRAVECDLLSLQGRVYKQLFVASSSRVPPARRNVREAFLQRAVRGYGLAYARLKGLGGENFPAGNLLALATLARRMQMTAALPEPAEKIAQGILARVAALAQAGQPVPAWDHASAAEAHAYLGDWDAAARAIETYLGALKAEVDAAEGGPGQSQVNAFAINGTYRQFTEVWGINPADSQRAAILNLLRYALMAAEGGSVVLDAAQTQQLLAPPGQGGADAAMHGAQAQVQESYEKVFGAEGPMGIGRLRDMINYSQLVARVQTDTSRGSDQTVGTAFLVPGEQVHASYAGRVLLLTNAHVISPDHDVKPATIPGEARVRFDTCGFDDAVALETGAMLWTSPPREHDATVFLIPDDHACHGALRAAASRLKIAKGLPPLTQATRDGNGARKPTRVYIIGHPMGQDLSFSLNDNDLLDHENVYGIDPGPEPRRIHYLAPTEPGSSGSPVFNSRTMELIGIHHWGGETARLNGKAGTYFANEGLWIRPLLTSFLLSMGLGVWAKPG